MIFEQKSLPRKSFRSFSSLRFFFSKKDGILLNVIMTDNTNVDLKHALGPAPANQASSSSNNVNVHDNSSPRPLQFTPIPEAGPAPQGTADKSSRWTARDDVILADALIAQKSLGRSHNAVFTLDAWNEIVEQLKGSEIISGGAQKTMVQCKARWQRVRDNI